MPDSHNIDAEVALIGALLIDGEAIDQVHLSHTDFYHAPCQLIFRACTQLKERGTAINQITVAHEIDTMNALETCGGVAFLSYCVANCPTSLDATDYAKIIKDLSAKRKLDAVGQQIANLASDKELDTVKMLDKADELLLGLRKSVSPPALVTPKDRALMMFDRYQTLYSSETPLSLSTGLTKLDKALGGGLQRGEFYVLAARPKMGKSLLLMQVANHVANSLTPALVVSAEMSIESISDRDVAHMACVPVNAIRHGHWDTDLHERVQIAVGEISERNVYFFEGTPNTGNILQSALAMQARHGLGALFIDHLGTLTDAHGKSAYERISYITRQINQMKKILGVPVMVANQLSRLVEHQQEKRPSLSHLRDSGSIEEFADVVMFMYRDNYYDWKSLNTDTEIIIAKNRQGEEGIAVVAYDKEHQKYIDKE